jgi:hypothetical protein
VLPYQKNETEHQWPCCVGAVLPAFFIVLHLPGRTYYSVVLQISVPKSNDGSALFLDI